MIVSGAFGITIDMNGGDCLYNNQVVKTVTVYSSDVITNGKFYFGISYIDSACGRGGHILNGFKNDGKYISFAELDNADWTANDTYVAQWDPVPAGTYYNSTCTTNGITYHCESAAGNNNITHSATPCPTDTYSTGGAAQCTQCPSGTTTYGKTGQTSIDACEIYCPAPFEFNGNECVAQICYFCPEGKSECLDEGAILDYPFSIGTDICDDQEGKKITGWKSSTGKSYSLNQTITATAGMDTDFSPIYGSVTCPAGKYLYNNTCTTCPANYYCTGGTANKTSCPQNGESNIGSFEIESCHITKTFSDSTGTYTYIYNWEPDDNAYSYQDTTSKKYTSCYAGYYMTKNGSYNGTPTYNNSCTICPAGSYCTGGTANKEACYTGGTSDPGSHDQTWCWTNKEDKDQSGKFEFICYQDAVDFEYSDCIDVQTYTSCNPGYYMTKNGSYNGTPTYDNSCTICPAGSFCTGGTANKTSCPTEHSSQLGANKCTPNTYTITLDYSHDFGRTETIKEVYGNRWTDASGNTITSVAPLPNTNYTIYYNANGGSVSPDRDTISYEFGGYYDQDGIHIDRTGAITADTTTFTNNTTLYPYWEYISGGQNLPTPTRTGYTFVGWYDTPASTGGTKYTSYTSDEDKTLYAKWTAKSITCAAGEYLPANSETCKECPVALYCSGGTWTYDGASHGTATCPKPTGVGTIGTWDGTKTTGATKIEHCIAYAVPFSLGNGSGTRRCLYTSGSGTSAKYETSCHYPKFETCTAGYYMTKNGTYNGTPADQNECSACDSGYYCTGGTANKTSCPGTDGVWTLSQDNKTSCSECAAVKTSLTNCSAGALKVWASNTNGTCTWDFGTQKITTTIKAKSGYYVDGASCSACAAGTYQPTNGSTTTSCTAADKGYYVSGAGASTQTACTGATYTDKTGQTSCTKCPTQTGASSYGYCCDTIHTSKNGCNAYFSSVPDNSTTSTGYNLWCYVDPDGKGGYADTYGVNGNESDNGGCRIASNYLNCKAGYYANPNGSAKTTAIYYPGTDSRIVSNTLSNLLKYACIAVGDGYYSPATSKDKYACSALSGVSVSGGKYTSISTRGASTDCQYTAPDKTIDGCASATSSTVTYSGTAWPANTYSVTANTGHIISGNNSTAPSCPACVTGYSNTNPSATSCTANTLTINLNKNGGTGTCGGKTGTTTGAQTCTYDAACNTPTWNSSTCNITNGTKILTGWNTKSDGTGTTYTLGASIKNIITTGSTTLYAIWKDTTCSVTNGTATATTSTNNTPRCTVTCNTGYGTSGTQSGTANTTSVNYTCNITTYTIAYYLNGGTNNANNPKTYTVESSDITLSNPTRSNSTFGGWYTESTFNTKVTTISSGSTGNKSLYAKWTCNNGWTANNDNTECIANTITLKWDAKNHGTLPNNAPTSCTYSHTSTISMPVLSADGYTFNGWNVTGHTTKWTDDNPATCRNQDNLHTYTGPVTFEANWTPISYTITYNLNGGTCSNCTTTSYTIETATFNLQTPTKTGYTFDGWYTESALTNKVTQITTGSTGNKTFYAKWTANCNAITIDANGGTTGTKTVYKKTNTTGWYSDSTCTTPLTSITVPTYTGYTLRGIYPNKKAAVNATTSSSDNRYFYTDGTKTSAGNSWQVTTDKTIYAAWAKDCSNPSNGTCSIEVGDFGAVAYNATCNSGYTVSNNTTATPVCTPNMYKVTMNNQGATSSGTTEYYYQYNTYGKCYYYTDETLTTCITDGTDEYTNGVRIVIPKRTGYTFGGYYTKTNGTGTQYINAQGGTQNGLYKVYANDVTLYAQWTPTTYNITYKLDGGTCSNCTTTSYTIETATFSLAEPTKDNYIFTGWTTNGKSITKITQGSTGDITLTAHWELSKVDCDTGYYLESDRVECTRCPIGSYCSGGTYEIKKIDQGINDCPSGYPNSNSGANNINQCYTACRVFCTKPTCPHKNATCEYNETDFTTGTQYYGGKCDAAQSTCEITSVSCKTGFNMTSQNICAEICPVGRGVLKTNGHEFQLYKTAQTKPALHIKYEDSNICYGSLEIGNKTGTINIKYDNKTYHIVN